MASDMMAKIPTATTISKRVKAVFRWLARAVDIKFQVPALFDAAAFPFRAQGHIDDAGQLRPVVFLENSGHGFLDQANNSVAGVDFELARGIGHVGGGLD